MIEFAWFRFGNDIGVVIEFLRPEWLLLAPAGLLTVVLWRRRGRDSPWRVVVDAELLPGLLADGNRAEPRWSWVALALGWLLAILALAGPAIERIDDGTMIRVVSRVIVLDLSPSMDSPDVTPSRLERARYKIRDLLRRPGEYQHGLVVFSGDAFTVSPVTADSATLLNLLDALSTDIMPAAGNRFDRAVALALELISRTGGNGEILLVTDGAGPEAIDAARGIRRAGSRLNVLGVGTEAGAPIVSPSGGFVRTVDGEILISGVDPTALGRLAEAGGGTARMMTLDDTDLDTLIEGSVYSASTRHRESGEPLTVWRDLGAWLLLPLLPLAMLAFRRGWLLAVLLAFPIMPEAHAFGWHDLWLRDDQQAARQIAAGNPDAALSSGDAVWQGVAQYRIGDYSSASESFTHMDGARGAYNRGNALARAGELEAALAAYDTALDLAPDFDDARFNRDLVERLLEKNESQGEQGDTSDSSAAGDDDESRPDSSESTVSDHGSQSPGEHGEGRSMDEEMASESHDEGQGTESGNMDDHGDTSDTETDPAGSTLADGEDAGTDSNPVPEPGSPQSGESSPDAETRQALENWLRQVPDDPQGLLRRKFSREYQLRQRERTGG